MLWKHSPSPLSLPLFLGAAAVKLGKDSLAGEMVPLIRGRIFKQRLKSAAEEERLKSAAEEESFF